MHAGRRRFSLAAGSLMSGVVQAQASLQPAPPATDQLPPRKRFRTSDGVSLSYLDTEAPGKRPALAIVLLPGWCMPAAIWRAQFAALGAYCRVFALDPRGQGESEVPEKGYTAPRRVADIHEFLNNIVPKRPRVLLVGWSLAALEALEYVKTQGEARLAGLALIDSSVGELPVPPGGGGSGESGFTRSLRADREKMLNDFIRAIFAKPRPADEIEALLQGALRIKLEDSIALLSYPFPREHWKEIAHAYAKPLLYAVTPQFSAQAENLKKNRPATQIEHFRRAGHALFVDEPERFNKLILDFARGLK
jgi:microsomal epoxide hydrolase